jgi:ATP-dependent Clp protease adaptor protein ClpS
MINTIMSLETQEELDVLEITEIEQLRDLILFNDDVNTFDFVIDALVNVCKHDLTQAEQCTYLVHYAGKCAVKRGEYNKLEPLCTALLDRGLSAEIQ